MVMCSYWYQVSRQTPVTPLLGSPLSLADLSPQLFRQPGPIYYVGVNKAADEAEAVLWKVPTWLTRGQLLHLSRMMGSVGIDFRHKSL